jgi:hypothetical protein
MVFGREEPKSMLFGALFSKGLPMPIAARLAVGELEGEAGDEETKLLRLAAAKAAGAPGESQKKDPRPGESSADVGTFMVNGD